VFALVSCASVPSPLPRRFVADVSLVPLASSAKKPRPATTAAVPDALAGRHRIIHFEACSALTHVTARWLAGSPRRSFPSKTSTVSLPPPPLRLLPAGATSCRAGLTPAENQHLSQRTRHRRLQRELRQARRGVRGAGQGDRRMGFARKGAKAIFNCKTRQLCTRPAGEGPGILDPGGAEACQN
jgi:hypothetical protein